MSSLPKTLFGHPIVVNPDMQTPPITFGRPSDVPQYCRRPDYHYDGRDLEWGKDLSPETLAAMRDNAEVFLLRDESGQPYSIVMSDVCDTLREKRVQSEPQRGIMWGSTR